MASADNVQKPVNFYVGYGIHSVCEIGTVNLSAGFQVFIKLLCGEDG